MTTEILTSLYEPLSYDEAQIRLIRILPSANKSKPVSCQLETVSLAQDPGYVALSYVWGDPEITEKIVVNGRDVQVTRNLESALRHFRDYDMLRIETGSTPLHLWVDAICINQQDLTEREQQVVNMGVIYDEARYVFSWLGELDDWRIDHAFRVIRDITPVFLQHYSEVSQEEEEHESHVLKRWVKEISMRPELCRVDNKPKGINVVWDGIRAIGKLSYWRRIWVYQEMAVARIKDGGHIFISGPEVVSIQDLLMFDTFLDLFRRLFLVSERPNEIEHEVWCFIGQHEDISFALSGVRRLSVLTYYMSRSVSALGGLVAICAEKCQATDARDMVYGVLGLMQTDIQPSYTKSVKEIYLDWFIKASKEAQCSLGERGEVTLYLDLVLSKSGLQLNRRSHHCLPTWLWDMSLSSLPELEFNYGLSCKGEGDAFNITFDPEKYACHEDGMLRVRGVTQGNILASYMLDARERSYQYWHDTPALRFWWPEVICSLFSWYQEKREGSGRNKLEQTQAFFYTLFRGLNPATVQVLDLRPHSQGVEHEILWVMMWCIMKTLQECEERGNAEEKSILPHCESAYYTMFSDLRDWGLQEQEPGEWAMNLFTFVWRHLGVLKGTSFFQTEAGNIGIGPGELRADEKVCLLNGCKSPVILRKTENGWVHVGICYVYDVSNQDPAEVIRRDGLEVDWFEIY